MRMKLSNNLHFVNVPNLNQPCLLT